MPRYRYPHTIDNGAAERLPFLRKVPGAGGVMRSKTSLLSERKSDAGGHLSGFESAH
jgi:hypothetical protein